MFDRKGYIVISNEEAKIDEDELTLEALEAGADDIVTQEDGYEIYTTPEAYQEVVDYLNEKGYSIEDSEVTLIPQNYNKLSEEDAGKMFTLIETLEENEDVQDIHHNLDETE